MTDAAKPILVIGSLNMDLVARCERLPERGQTIIGQDFFTAPGGKGANQAMAAARLGAPRVAMAGCVGSDDFGAVLVSGLRGAGIRTDAVRTVDAPTGTALITIDAAGANTIVVVSGANAACDATLVDHALAGAGGPGILLLQHEISEAANAHAIRVARRAGWFVMLNPAPARAVAADLLPLIDVLVPNETEIAALAGRTLASRNDVLAAADALLAQGARAILVTLGADGALYRDTSQAWHCPALPLRAVDTTAAGDAYIGAFAAALAEPQPLAASLGLAAAAAGHAVTVLGAQPSLPTRQQRDAFIARHGMPIARTLAG